MIRSFLFVPGDSERKLAKAAQSNADAIIIDLEDATAPQRKGFARKTAFEFLLQRGRYERSAIFVRVNPLDSGLLVEDLSAVMPGAPAGIVLPKCAGQSDLDTLGRYLDALELRAQLMDGPTSIIAIATETARAVVNLVSQAPTHPRLLGLMWGAEDLSADIGAETNRDESGQYLGIFSQIRNHCLLAAKALGVLAIDAVYTDISNQKGLAEEVEAARRMGFESKAAIHPNQIKIIHTGIAPTQPQIDWAQRVRDAFGSRSTTGVVKLDGRMLDRPHLRQAERILERAGLLSSDSTENEG